MRIISIILLSLFLAGCERKEAVSPPAQSSNAGLRSFSAIQKIVAEQLGRPVADIRPDSTFASLGADELDLVEIVMAIEDAMNITIDDDALSKAAEASDADKLVASLTIQKLATFADSAPKR